MTRSKNCKILTTPLLLFLLSIVSIVKGQAANGFVVYTPTSLSTCQTASITWDKAASGKIYLSIVPGGKPDAKPLLKFKEMDASTKLLPWTVNLPAGTSVTIMGTDQSGQITGSAAVTIQEGSDTSCVGKEQPSQDGAASASSPPNDGGGSNQWTSSSQWSDPSSDSSSKGADGSARVASSTSNSNSGNSAATAGTSISQLKTPSSNGAANTTSPVTPLTPKIDAKNTTLTPSTKPSSTSSKPSTSGASRIFNFSEEQIMLSASVILTSTLIAIGIL